MSNEVLIRVAKTAAWERAKGELRAMCQAQAHMRIAGLDPSLPSIETDRWERLNDIINEFIEKVEDDGLEE